jgi:hypothetical protein
MKLPNNRDMDTMAHFLSRKRKDDRTNNMMVDLLSARSPRLLIEETICSQNAKSRKETRAR